MAEPEYPVLQELETKLKLLWVDTDDYMATQRAIIEVTPENAYMELPRGVQGQQGPKGDKGDKGEQWVKRDLTTGEDLNTVTAPGLYTVLNYTRALSLLNRPDISDAIDRSAVEVLPSGGGAFQQTWYPMGVASRTDMPVMRRRRDTAGAWTDWERINAFTPAKESHIMQSISAANWEKRALVHDENLNNLTTAGLYYVPNYTIANSLVNNPIELSRSAIDRAKIEVATTLGHVSQIWSTIPSATKAAETVERHRDTTGEWSPWVVYGGGSRDEDKPVTSFETLALASHGMEGEHVGTRSLLQALSGEESPVWSWWAPTPTSELEIPTHDGGGQTCHPSVLYFPNTWGGWKYWMAHTPYPNFQEAHEDPNIAVSDDGVNWQVPNGLTNPLDDGLGRPNYHNSDTHLAMWGNTMVLTWRTVDRPNGGQNIIYARTSQNGVTWTPKVEVLKVPLGSAESTFVSQSLVKMPTGWRLYGIRSNYGPNRLGYYETSVETLPKTSDWGAAQNCDLGTIQTGRDPWHSEVQRLSANDWVAVISDGNRGSTGVDGDIYLARSTDGVAWDVSPMPLTPRNNGVINSLYKTGFVVSGTGTNRVFDLWVSGYRSTSRTWAVYKTRAEFRTPNPSPTQPITRTGTGSPEGQISAPVGSVYTDTAATNGSVRWIKASGTGATGWRDYYGDTIEALEAKADKTYVDAEKWYRGRFAGSVDTLFEVGLHDFGPGEATGLPFDDFGFIEVIPTSFGAFQRATNWRTQEVWQRRSQNATTYVTEWTKVANLKDLQEGTSPTPPDDNGSSPSGSWRKLVPVPITTGSAQGLTGETSAHFRIRTQIPAPVTRFRLHIDTRYTISSSGSGEVTLNSVEVGHHTGGGAITDTTDILPTSVTIPSGGEWVSDWHTHDFTQETLVGYDFTSPDATWKMLAPAFIESGGTWTQTNRAALWVWIEVEVAEQVPVVAMIGDSIGSGHGAAQPVWESATHIAARAQGFIPVLYTSTGDTLAGNQTLDDRNFTKLVGHGGYDSVIVQLGTNDINKGTTLSELQALYEGTVNIAKSLGEVVLAGTITPLAPTRVGYEFDDVRRQFNDWLRTKPYGIWGVIDFDAALTPGGVLDEGDLGDGIHPTSAGFAKLSLAFDRPISRPPVVLNAGLAH